MPFLAPLVGAVTTAISSIGILGQLALGIGLQFVSASIEKRRAKKAAAASAGVQFERQYGETVPRQVACGRVGIAGHDAYVNSYGNANNVLQQLYVFSDFPCDGLVRVWADGKLLNIVDFGGGYYKVVGGDYDEIMAFQWHDGTQGVADASLVANSNPAGRWTADHIGTGQCYVIVYLTYKDKVLMQVPEFFFEIRGARLYDVRKDSTAGGVGPHRWGDYSTYEFTENPVIMDYNYRRGFSINGDMFCGMAISAADLPVDRYAIAANICDEATPDGPRYRCSVFFSADIPHGDNIDAVMQSCGGIVVDGVDGSWPLIGSDQPIVETITDDDLVSGEPVRFQRYRSQADLVNAVQGTYPDPDNQWSPAGYDTQTSTAQVALDRRTRDFGLNFSTVPYKAQANQLASIYYKENRLEATAEIVVRPRFQTVKAGDWIRWNSALYGDRTWMVASRAIKALSSNGPRNVVLSLVERNGSIYDSVGVLPPIVPLPPGQPVYVNALPDFAIIATIAVGADTRSYPAFRLSWSAIADPTIVSAEFQWRIKTDPTNIFRRTVPADALIAFIQEGVLSLTEYEFRYQLLVEGRVPPPASAWVSRTSLDGGHADLAVELDRLGQSALDRFEELQAEMDDFFRPRLVELTEAFSLQGAVGETRRQELLASIGQSFAEIVQEARVRASEDAALAQFYTSLSAQVGSNLARLITEETARATGDSALANSLGILSADVGTNLARLITEETARANGDSALASSVSDLSGQVGTNLARLITEETARATGDSALTTSVSDLTSQVGTNLARLVTEETTRANADSALSSSVTGVSADLNGRFAQGLMTLQAAANQAGVNARFAIMIRAGTGVAFKESGLYLEIYTEGGVQKSRVAIIADQFIVSDGTNSAKPLAFVGGVLKLINAQIEQAQIENLIVGTHNIAPEAATAMAAGDGYSVTFGSSFTTIAAVDLVHGAGNPKVTIDWAVLTPGVAVEYRVVNASTGYVMFTYSFPATANNWCCLAQDVSDKSALLSSLYYLQARSFSAGSFTHPFAIIRAIALKR